MERTPTLDSIRINFFGDIQNLGKFRLSINSAISLLNNNIYDTDYSKGEELKELEVNNIEKWTNFSQLDARVYSPILNNLIIVNGIALFESLKTELVSQFLKNGILNKTITQTSDLKISIDNLLEYDTIDSLHDFLIEKIIRNISSGYWFKEQSKICQLIKRSINVEDDLKCRIDLYHALRNIILHNGGVVNAEFLKLVSNSKYDLGVKVLVSKEETMAFLIDIMKLGELYIKQFEEQKARA